MAAKKARAGSCLYRSIYVGDGKIGSHCGHPRMTDRNMVYESEDGGRLKTEQVFPIKVPMSMSQVLRITSPLVCSDCAYRVPTSEDTPIRCLP